MKNLRNSVQLIGRLGKDPEVKSLTSGSTLATFTLATTESYKNTAGEKVEETQWHNLVAWGKTADIASQYLKKGQEIAVEGKLIHRSYENAKGDKRYVTEINVNEILMLNKKR
ncbi:single-stranded DNA-binding protein [Fulvivirga maritima]|uniref:single-stranded DNA-binding protein n=1 Tax=Fulvivirga maritima TaxID=2904247 RepID=UPI001F1EDB84|nr:single-stranded DNA-binding protein [Fulvivirga maritima]UII24502.1 single-stranded DNA-binding protein [Fulvivirga maritima]